MGRSGYALSFVLGLGMAAGCSERPEVWVESEKTFRFPIDTVQSVDVKTHNGDVSLGVSSSDEAVVRVLVRAGGRDEQDAAACLEQLRLIVDVRLGELRARYDLPGRRPSWAVQVSFDVVQPAQALAEVVTHNGRIEVSDLESGVSLETHNGRIELNEVDGLWRAVTHNGAIEARGVPGEIRLATHNGRVTARIGGVGTLSGTVHSHNGSIELTVASDRDTELQCSTHSGGIRVSEAFRMTEATKKRYRGVLGQGGGALKVTTHHGGVRVR